MNIQEFINSIKDRPKMYVDELRIEYIYYLVTGFLGSNLINGNDCDTDRRFKMHFHNWLEQWVRENKDKHYKIKSFFWYSIFKDITNDSKEAVTLFFELCDVFFRECDVKIYNFSD